MNPEELLNFLRRYEPALAKSLDKLRADDMDAYRRKMFAMMRLYGPVMREMQFNPDLGKISLANIRLRLEIEQDVNKYKTVGDKKEKEQIKAQLTGNVGQLFDSILNREGLRLKSFQQRLDGWNAPPGLDSDAGSGRPGMGRDRRGGGRGGFGRGPREERGRDIHGRLDERKKQIEDWRKHKEDIVNARVAVLLQGTKPFPWE